MWLRRRAAPSLRGRVSGLALAVIAGWLVVLAAGFDLVLVSRIDGQVDDALRVRAQAASATVDARNGQVVGVRESATDSELDSSIWIYSGRRAIVTPAVSAYVRRGADTLATAPTGYAERAGHRFYVLPVLLNGGRAGTIIASIDLAPYERTEHIVVLGSLIISVLLLGGAYPVLRYATGRALRPVAEMTRQAAEWSVHAPGQRFGEDQTYAELGSLAGRLDELLDRLAAVMRHERHLSAELSHELRTPLARVAAQVELVLDDARPDQRAELSAIRNDCAQMDGIIDALLAAARTELVRTVGRCDLAPVLAEIAAEQQQPLMRVDAHGLSVGVDRDIVVRILSPLIDNARRFARREIAVVASRGEHGIHIDVSNDGEPLDPNLAEDVFAPGFRAGPGDGHDGAGLGLALARRLARSADGELTVDTTAERTTFRLLLPAG